MKGIAVLSPYPTLASWGRPLLVVLDGPSLRPLRVVPVWVDTHFTPPGARCDRCPKTVWPSRATVADCLFELRARAVGAAVSSATISVFRSPGAALRLHPSPPGVKRELSGSLSSRERCLSVTLSEQTRKCL